MRNIIKANKLYRLGSESKSNYKPLTKEEIINQIIDMPVLLMKGERDELIKNDDSWNLEHLKNMDEYSLLLLRDFARIKFKSK